MKFKCIESCIGPWWWSSGHRARLLLHQSLESLQFSVILLKRTNINKKEPWLRHLKNGARIREWYSIDHFLLLLLKFCLITSKSFHCHGSRHSSVDPSAPTILKPWVQSRCTIFALFLFSVERDKNNQKEVQIAT